MTIEIQRPPRVVSYDRGRIVRPNAVFDGTGQLDLDATIIEAGGGGLGPLDFPGYPGVQADPLANFLVPGAVNLLFEDGYWYDGVTTGSHPLNAGRQDGGPGWGLTRDADHSSIFSFGSETDPWFGSGRTIKHNLTCTGNHTLSLNFPSAPFIASTAGLDSIVILCSHKVNNPGAVIPGPFGNGARYFMGKFMDNFVSPGDGNTYRLVLESVGNPIAPALFTDASLHAAYWDGSGNPIGPYPDQPPSDEGSWKHIMYVDQNPSPAHEYGYIATNTNHSLNNPGPIYTSDNLVDQWLLFVWRITRSMSATNNKFGRIEMWSVWEAAPTTPVKHINHIGDIGAFDEGRILTYPYNRDWIMDFCYGPFGYTSATSGVWDTSDATGHLGGLQVIGHPRLSLTP